MMKKLLLLLTLVCVLFSNEVIITSKDGFELHGWLSKPKTSEQAHPIMLFAHQFGADHQTWSELAKKFNAKGFATLNVDLRGHGKSIYQKKKENKVITPTNVESIKNALFESDSLVGFKNIPEDLQAWLEYASNDKGLDMDKLYLFGSSLGGGSIIPLLNEYDAKALVTLSAGKQKALEEDLNMALSTSMTKELFIASKDDPLGAATRALEYANKSIRGTSLIISGSGHGTVMLPQVENYIFSFIDGIR